MAMLDYLPAVFLFVALVTSEQTRSCDGEGRSAGGDDVCESPRSGIEVLGAAAGDACDIPRYDIDWWRRRHGSVFPDTPAIFTGVDAGKVFPGAGLPQFANERAFLERYGKVRIDVMDESIADGGLIIWLNQMQKAYDPRRRMTVAELFSSWNKTYQYYAAFECEPVGLCEMIRRKFGSPQLFDIDEKTAQAARRLDPSLGESSDQMYFLMGGPRSGLPFHRHKAAWQGLAHGRKAWYLVPPKRMRRDIHDLVGPQTFSARFWAAEAARRPLGDRPLHCVQEVGEIVFVPHHWWHATLNLGDFNLAFGKKLSFNAPASASTELVGMLKPYPLNEITKVCEWHVEGLDEETRELYRDVCMPLDLQMSVELIRYSAESNQEAQAQDLFNDLLLVLTAAVKRDPQATKTAATALCLAAGLLRKCTSAECITWTNRLEAQAAQLSAVVHAYLCGA